MGNVINVTFDANRTAETYAAYQYDYGQILKIENMELPTAYEVHFSNSIGGQAITSIGDADGVDIPDQLLATGKPVYFWLYLHTGDSDGETEYSGMIPVIPRASMIDYEPTPKQQDAITQAIEALNSAVESTGQDAETASTAATAATAAQAAAEGAQASAETAATAAETAQGRAESAQTAAETAQTAAETAQGKAEDAQEAAESAVTAAQAAAEESAGYVDVAAGKASDAAESASDAAASATSAAGSASAAAGSASTAAGKATEAGASATAAAGSASTASTKAGEAATSATNAAASATAANAAKTAAQTAQTGAETAQTAAETAAASVSASAAQIETNKTDITHLKQDINELETVFNDVYQIEKITVSSAPHVMSVLFSVAIGNTFRVKNSTSATMTFRFVMADNTSLQEKDIPSNTTVDVTSTVNADHIRVFFNGTGTASVEALDKYIPQMLEDINELDNTVDSISASVKSSETSYNSESLGASAGYINVYGSISGTSGSSGYYYSTNTVHAYAGDVINFVSSTASFANTVVIAEYSSANSYSPLVTGASNKSSYTYTVQHEGDYAFTLGSGTNVVTVISAPVIDREIDELTDSFFKLNKYDYLPLFHKVACLGDSLTRGFNTSYQNGERNRDFGYPWVLARKTQLKVWNYGHSGATPSYLYSDLQNTDFSGFDLAIICLGRNGGLESDADKTAYQNLITKLQTDNAHMTIFICSLPAYGKVRSSGDTTINARIQTIAEANNLPYIDLWGNYGSADYTNGDVHYNTLGYIKLCDAIIKGINNYISTHMNDFKNLWMPDTLPDYIDAEVY